MARRDLPTCYCHMARRDLPTCYCHMARRDLPPCYCHMARGDPPRYCLTSAQLGLQLMVVTGLPSLTISVRVDPQLMLRLSRKVGRFASKYVLRGGGRQ